MGSHVVESVEARYRTERYRADTVVAVLDRLIEVAEREDPDCVDREVLIDRFLTVRDTLTRVFEEIPADWECVCDCPTKLDFVRVFLLETFGVIDLAEDVLDTGLE